MYKLPRLETYLIMFAKLLCVYSLVVVQVSIYFLVASNKPGGIASSIIREKAYYSFKQTAGYKGIPC